MRKYANASSSLPRLRRILAGVAMFMGATSQAIAACNAGPDYCTDDPRIPQMLADKKASLAKDYPARLVALLDRGTQCVARIRQSPDGFTMVVVKKGAIDTVGWDQDNEDVSKKEIASGDIERFWIVNSRRAFSCEGQPSYDQQPDYNAADDVNTSLAIKCDSGGC